MAFGLTMLSTQIGWHDTRKLIHRKKKKAPDEATADGDLASADP